MTKNDRAIADLAAVCTLMANVIAKMPRLEQDTFTTLLLMRDGLRAYRKTPDLQSDLQDRLSVREQQEQEPPKRKWWQF